MKMTVHYKDLHLVDSIEALNALEMTKKVKEDPSMDFSRKCKALETLFKEAQNNRIDQEIAYVYLKRFLRAYDRYVKTDKKFMEIRFKSQVSKSREQLEQLEKDLTQRYSEKRAIEKGDERPAKKKAVISSSSKKFPDDHISCEELYSALQSPNNILLVDARPAEDFKQSRIKINTGKLINVPDHVIKNGLSANAIGEALPNEYQPIWNMRDSFDIIVLLDWNSTYDNMMATKLEKLLTSLVEWDIRKEYRQKPIILNGGYIEWGEKYPSTCINPNIVFNKMYNDLDELLNLDNIQYPSDDNKVPIITFQETNLGMLEQPEDVQTREELIRTNKELSKKSDIILNQLIEQENKWKEMKIQKDSEQLKNLEKNITNLRKQLEVLTDQKNETQEQFELFAGFDPQKENLEVNQIKEMAEIDEAENQKRHILETINQNKLDELAKARALKPKAAGDPNLSPSPSTESGRSLKGGKTDKPMVNRTNKPTGFMPRPWHFDGPITSNPDGKGLVGLKNIRNTCYMNTTVQCMRNIPKLSSLFCTGLYKSYVRKKPDAVIMETASLFRLIWSSIQKCVNPMSFYEKVCAIEPNYQMGNHEDCMEFFLFILNNLSEDCSCDVQKPEMMSPMQQAWFNQLGGKISIFIELFYHQLRITQICQNCNKQAIKFEMESTFMLPVPEHDFKVEDLMKNYLKDYIIDDYCCSKCRKPVTNSKSICKAPEILVIVLKRYKQVVRNNNVSVSKVDSRVYFPTTNFIFGSTKYNLNSIAMHSGSMTSGHYTAACLTNYKWYEFNDEIVRPINIDDDAVRSKACAFFYSRT